MPRKRFTPEQIIGKLREAEIFLSKGLTAQQAARKLGATEIMVYGKSQVEYSRQNLAEAAIFLTLDWRIYRVCLHGEMSG